MQNSSADIGIVGFFLKNFSKFFIVNVICSLTVYVFFVIYYTVFTNNGVLVEYFRFSDNLIGNISALLLNRASMNEYIDFMMIQPVHLAAFILNVLAVAWYMRVNFICVSEILQPDSLQKSPLKLVFKAFGIRLFEYFYSLLGLILFVFLGSFLINIVLWFCFDMNDTNEYMGLIAGGLIAGYFAMRYVLVFPFIYFKQNQVDKSLRYSAVIMRFKSRVNALVASVVILIVNMIVLRLLLLASLNYSIENKVVINCIGLFYNAILYGFIFCGIGLVAARRSIQQQNDTGLSIESHFVE